MVWIHILRIWLDQGLIPFFGKHLVTVCGIFTYIDPISKKKQPFMYPKNNGIWKLVGTGDPRTLLYTSKPLFFGGSNDS